MIFLSNEDMFYKYRFAHRMNSCYKEQILLRVFCKNGLFAKQIPKKVK